MLALIKKQWFLLALAAAALLGFFFPQWGAALRHFDIFSAGIFTAFLITGLSLETRAILRQITGIRAPAAAVISSLILYPVVAWFLARPLLPEEFVVGVCIIAVAPVTVSSGTLMTAIARGNVPLSLLICLATSFLAIFTIPLMLKALLSLGAEIDLPVLSLLTGLLVQVLLPIVIGQMLRPPMKQIVRRLNRQLSVFQSLIIILIIFNAVSSSAGKIAGTGPLLLVVVCFVILLQLLMLLINYALATVLRLDQPSRTAFTIHTSQKTLTVTFIVWSGYFAADYPMAFIPAIVCQLSQMTLGTFVADYFRRRAERPA